MIRVLIVDDDKLVRKGLISSMPWTQFGMEVVGEANNGENALIFLESNGVDLLLTDLSMPVMSGIELMRAVRIRFPQIRIVVLTLHQDFEYIQEALRLGAIDYIAKVQLEREQFEEVLGRIVTLMAQKPGGGHAAASAGEWERTECQYVLYSLSTIEEAAGADIRLPGQAVEADAGIWWLTEEAAAEFEPNPHYAIVCLRGLKGKDKQDVLQLSKAYGKNELFYDYDPDERCLEADAAVIAPRSAAGNGVAMDRIKMRWLSADWINDERVFRQELAELKELRMTPLRLARIFFSLSDEWNRMYRQLLAEPIAIDEFFPSLHRFELWIDEVRGRIRQANARPLFSDEIQNSIVKAMNTAQQRIGDPISASEMAQMVNMSSSYFSQCFKQYVGQTYTDYVRDIRMERAKEYLRTTTKTIQWIAEQTGYADEKYFSRLFREHAGVLPSEYRSTAERS